MKRLLLSLAMVGATVSVLGFGAQAYFFDGSTSDITVNAADALDVTFDIDEDCDTVYEASGLDTIPDATTEDLFPGDFNEACIRVNNTSTTDVNIYVLNNNFTEAGPPGLTAELLATIVNQTANTTPCQAVPTDPGYTTPRGCLAGNIDPLSSEVLRATVLFVDDGSDQSALGGSSASWEVTVGAYTTP